MGKVAALPKNQGNHALIQAIAPVISSARSALGLERDEVMHILLAVSGGMDSCALLALLLELKQQLRLELSVAHLDHQLRDSSAREATFVCGLAEQAGLRVSTARMSAYPSGENLEAWARSERYKFLEQVRTAHGADLIATAHHRNDQAETVLFRLLSGRLLTDARSIAGLNLKRRLFRPLLGLSREDLAHYAAERCLPFVTDESNFDLNRTRNRLRHELIPQLERELNPQLVDALGDFGERLGEDEKFLWSAAEQIAADWRQPVACAEILAAAPAMRWRLIRLSAEKQIGEAALYLGYSMLKRVEAELENGPSGPFDLGFGITYRIDDDRHLILRSKGSSRLSANHLLD